MEGEANGTSLIEMEQHRLTPHIGRHLFIYFAQLTKKAITTGRKAIKMLTFSLCEDSCENVCVSIYIHVCVCVCMC